MDLTKPCYESILQIDQRLEDLQKEVSLMEREYGFKEKHVNLLSSKSKQIPSKTKTLSNKTLQEKPQEKTRYNNLSTIKLDGDTNMKKLKIVPKISQTWKDVFRKKPDNSYFMERNRIESIGIENKDLKPKSNYQEDLCVFEEYMNDYALRVLDIH